MLFFIVSKSDLIIEKRTWVFGTSGRRPGKEVIVEQDNDDKYIDVNDEPSDDDFVDMGRNSVYASGLQRSGRNKDKEVYYSGHAKTMASGSKGKGEKQGRKRSRETCMSKAEKKADSDKPAGNKWKIKAVAKVLIILNQDMHKIGSVNLRRADLNSNQTELPVVRYFYNGKFQSKRACENIIHDYNSTKYEPFNINGASMFGDRLRRVKKDGKRVRRIRTSETVDSLDFRAEELEENFVDEEGIQSIPNNIKVVDVDVAFSSEESKVTKYLFMTNHESEMWAVVHNDMEEYRSNDLPFRLFLPTFVLDKDSFSELSNDDGRFNIVVRHVEPVTRTSSELKKLKKIDLVFLPVDNEGHRFLLAFDLKYGAVMVFDQKKKDKSVKRSKLKKGTKIGKSIVAEMLRADFGKYIHGLDHIKAANMIKAELEIGEYEWQTAMAG
ncbi:hypothetical protein Tco_0934147 [Tanacetum coccineum]